MKFKVRGTELIVLFICISFMTDCVVGHSIGETNDENDFQYPTKGSESKWQMFKSEFQHLFGKIKYFFTNDIPHFFKEDIPEEITKIKNVVKKGESTVKSEMKDLENAVETEFHHVNLQDSCECIHYSCGCCQHLEEPSIHLNSTLCANATYLSEDIGISLTVTVNGYAIFNETVSVRNPPPVCLGVPYVKEWAEACVHFYDIDATRTHLHACARVEARMKHVLIAKYELGCFDIGPVALETNQKTEQLKHEQPFVMLV